MRDKLYRISVDRVKPSRKADYALRAALDLALHVPPGRVARTAEVARRTGAPERFLEAILGELRRAGLLVSRRGAGGGHRLARSPALVTVGELWRVIDGPMAQAERPGRRRAPDAAARALAAMWAEVDEAVSRVVEGVTLEELARRAHEAGGVRDFTI